MASDMSVFHRVRDIGSMRSVTFLRLASRLAAYSGAVAARLAAERRAQPQRSGRVSRPPRYERRSEMANNGHTAAAAPPARAADFARLNAQLGAQWFSYRTADGGREGGDVK